MTTHIREQIGRSFFWIVASRIGVQMVSFVSSLVVARWLNPADYGILAIASVWTSATSLLMELGLGTAIIQFPDLEDRDINGCFWFLVGASIGMYSVLFVMAPFISQWFANENVSDILRVLGIILPLYALEIVPDSLLRKRIAFDRISQIEILATFPGVLVVLVLAWLGSGVWSLVFGTLVRELVSLCGAFWFAGWFPGLSMRRKRLREIVNFSLSTLGSKIGWVLYNSADSIVLGKVAGDFILGQYVFAKDLALVPATKVSVLLNQVSFPVMAGLQTDRSALRDSSLLLLRITGSVVLPMCLGFILVADDFVVSVLTKKWAAITPLLQIFAVFAVVQSLDLIFRTVLLARYRAAFLLKYTLVVVILMPLAFWLAAVWFGSIGVAGCWALLYPLLLIMMGREVVKELDVTWEMVWDQMRLVIIAVMTMTAIVIALQWSLADTKWAGPLIRLLLASCIGGGHVWLPTLRFG